MTRTSRHATAFGLMALALGAVMVAPALAVPGGMPAGSGKTAGATGGLTIEVAGARGPVRIVVTSENGYRKIVTKDVTLKSLPDGTYRVQPSPFVTPKGKPMVTVSQRAVDVSDLGDRPKVTVTYSVKRSVRQVGVGEGAACAVLASGAVQCWGDNDAALLGDRAMWSDREPWPASWPMARIKHTGEVRAATVDRRTACALRFDGRVLCWGWIAEDNGRWALSEHPVAVLGEQNATAVASGTWHTCALRRSGRVECWGGNWSGQLGSGSSVFSAEPVRVKGIEDATAIAAGADHTCALLAGGSVWCWGENERGQLGNNTEIDARTPVRVEQLSRATAIAAGRQHTCAVLRDGSMKCWGMDENGQLGSAYPYMDGDDRWTASPRTVKTIHSAVAASAGDRHTCAKLRGGALWCWGANSSGQLGNGSSVDADKPVTVRRISDAKSVSAGGLSTCAVRSGGKVSCWGAGGSGQLGNGHWKDSAVAVRVLGFGR